MQHQPYNSAGAGSSARRTRRRSSAAGDDLELTRQTAVAADRFTGRRRLLDEFDGLRRSVDGASVDGMDAHYRRAFEVLTSDKVAKALDVEREDPRTATVTARGRAKHLGDGAPMWNDQLLIARRLVEAGARCVSVAYGFWDTHGSNFAHLKHHLPLFDRGISALVEDIHMRGLADDVTVVVWGEFGRTPKINAQAGRDHWAPVNGALLAGGGMKVGQVIGSTDKPGRLRRQLADPLPGRARHGLPQPGDRPPRLPHRPDRPARADPPRDRLADRGVDLRPASTRSSSPGRRS